jgi:hypothetical protein
LKQPCTRSPYMSVAWNDTPVSEMVYSSKQLSCSSGRDSVAD